MAPVPSPFPSPVSKKGGGRAKSYDSERAYSSVNPSILSGLNSSTGKVLNNFVTFSFLIIAIDKCKEKITHIPIDAVSNSL
jgi:hypothetical protein